MAVREYKLNGLDCEHCAARLERKIQELPGVDKAAVEYPSCKCTVESDDPEIEEKLIALIKEEEPDVICEHKHHHDHDEHEHHHGRCHDEHCGCEEHHHHDHEEEHAVYMFEITGIDCANCAAKLEKKISELEGIEDVHLNYEESTLQYTCDHDEGKAMEEKVRALTAQEEPEAVITSKGHKHLHHHDHEEHEHHHEHEEKEAVITSNTHRYKITGIDCADCAAKLEHKLESIRGISNVHISFIKSQMLYDCAAEDLERIEKEVEDIKNHEEPEAVIEPISDTKTYKFRIAGIDCADCAEKLARLSEKIPGVVSAEADFMNELIRVACMPSDVSSIEQQMRTMIADEEPDVVFSRVSENTKKETEEPEADDRTMRIRLIIGALLFVCALFMQVNTQMILSICAWLVLGYDVLIKAVRGIGRGQVFDEHFLMAVATLAAIYLKDYKEAAGVMLFYQIGEYFQDLAVRRSRRSIGELMDIRPDKARVLRGGEFVSVDPEEVAVGETVQVKPGERIPLDGIVTEGYASLDTSSLTGESKLRDCEKDDEVISGSVSRDGVLEIKVTKVYAESTVSRILELVENSESNKASQEKFITKFSRWYTPIVVFSAIAVAVIVGILMKDFNEGIYRACTFLVISCPCALVISVPLSFFAGIGGLSSKGVLVKGANVIETLAKTKQIVLDKTGTLTTGTFAVENVLGTDDRDTALEYAAYAEYYSNHPLAAAVRSAYNKEIHEDEISDIREIPGRGISAMVKGKKVLAGNYKLMAENNIECKQETEAGSLVYVACGDTYAGCLVLNDQLKADAAKAVKEMHEAGMTCSIVTGDNEEIAQKAGGQIHADAVYAGCLPQDKVETVRKIKEKGITAFVGDGINDAPVLALADTGFAMGALGSDAAIEAADVVIMDDSPSKVSLAVRSAQRILKVANQNIYGAIAVKILTLILGAFGIANMWIAIFADTGVAMLCVLNSLRLLRISE